MGKLDGQGRRSSPAAGRASARRPRALFLQEGAKVVIAGRDAAKLDAVAAEANAGDNLLDRRRPT